jgi:transglutaminase-like putative cysteine protease
MVRWVRSAVVAVALAGMIALSGVALGRIFAGPLLAELVAGAAVGSVGIGAAARRLPSSAVAPLSVAVLSAYTILVLWVSAERADVAGPLSHVARDSLVNGIPRLLTAMIPVEPTPDTVIVPVIAAWLAGLAGTEIAVRAGRVLFGIAPAAVLYVASLYVVGPNAGAAGWPTLAFAGLAVAALAVSARPADAGALREVPAKTRAAVRARAVAGAAAGLVVVLGLVVAVGPWIGAKVAAEPVDPRQYVQPPQVDSLDESPLNRISGWALSPEQQLVDVGPVSPPAKAKTVRLRLAVMPDYDGVTWKVGATYRNAGRVLPETPRLPGAVLSQVRQSITVEGLTGRLLPVVPTPDAVDGARVAFDQATGTLIRPEGLTPALRYTVTSIVQTPDLNELPGASTPSGPGVARYLAVGPGVPDDIQRLADQMEDGNGAPYDRASAIEDFLSGHYRKVADAPSGHAYPNLQFFLFGPRNQGGQRGTSEQFAASFALLARLDGLPSRVAVGFDAPSAGGQVTAADAIAWPEVLFDDLGWVAFDPMPKSNNPRPVEEDFTPKPPPPSDPSTPPQSAPVASASAAPSALAPAHGGGLSGVVVASGASGSVLILLVAAAGVLLSMRRSLSRRRLFAGSPDARIEGAWSEFTDALRLSGRPVPAHLAATEAADFGAAPPPRRRGLLRRAAPAAERPAAERAAAERASAAGRGAGGRGAVSADAGGAGAGSAGTGSAGTGSADESARPGGVSVAPAGATVTTLERPAEALPPLDELAAGINTVGFAPGAAGSAQAEKAAEQVVAYSRALREQLPWWRRVWWSVHPGPLRWQRRR